ncbi:hypothetical protein GCM10022243_34290 [Saccharothrix violaceirubra]|uniref:DUF397 domain-containing protein n=1 Tax=Saccharothrix violaceirubra TaxID=413306 RepID=A0A7W7T758_9PSEU|nr:DUF397 domain-containing protein [Saccharothrix violaceirubra]MBB4966480.1 hypothetical protein [Saccharothrix violaceirubra]
MTSTWTWRKSRRSAGNGACVELATRPGTRLTAVRDSKIGDDSPVLAFGPGGMRAFLLMAKDGKLDHPA